MDQRQKVLLIIASMVVVVLAALLFVGLFWGGQGICFGMMGRGMMGGSGAMFFMVLFWLVVVGLVIWVVSAVFRRSSETNHTDYKDDSAMEILKRRYAQGEIDKEEFEAKKKDLA